MEIKEIMPQVLMERQTPGRFPCRLIFARGFKDYIALVSSLTASCDAVIDLKDFTNGDLFPNFKAMRTELAKHPEKRLLLLSIGEYLRCCVKRELDRETAVFPGFWGQQQSEASITKYYIPIFGGREIFDTIMHIQDERQKMFIWEVSESEIGPDYSLTIYSPEFKDAIGADALNFQEWLQKWESLYNKPNQGSFTLVTKLYRYAEPTYGRFQINIVEEPFGYVSSLASDGKNLKKTDGSDEFWRFITNYVVKGKPFADTIKFKLNIGHHFDPTIILARYKILSANEQHLLIMWYKLYPTNDYFTYAISKAQTPSQVPNLLRDSIFSLTEMTDDFIRQRNNALCALDISYSDEYFTKLDKIQLSETRLKLLTYKTLPERAYAVKTASILLRDGASITSVASMLEHSYPKLSAYLSQMPTETNSVSEYFNWYRINKVINRPNKDVPREIDVDAFDSRNKVIQKYLDNNCELFWVDGLGAEWLPVLLSIFTSIDCGFEISIKYEITKAILPSETEYNHKWVRKDTKWDRLDKLSHSGMPDSKDYFLCIARQLEIMDEIAEHAIEMLANVNKVIITGDHGSSRLAALLFHDADNFSFEPPKDSIVRAFGRFAEITATGINNDSIMSNPYMEYVETDGKRFVVMKTYDHFKQSGNPAGGNTDETAIAGEVHGGMTPEECLVPVIALSRKKPIQTKELAENNLGLILSPIIVKESPEKPKGIIFNDEMQGLP